MSASVVDGSCALTNLRCQGGEPGRKKVNGDTSLPAGDHDRYCRIALDITRAGLSVRNQLRLHVVGWSMMPLLRPGDAVWVEPAGPASLRRGDLVVTWRGGELVTHRLVAVDHRGWHTKGDSQRHADSPVVAEAVLGRITAIEREGNRIELDSRRWRTINCWLGWLGWWEARLLQVGRRLKVRVPGAEPRLWTSVLASLITAPFRVLTRLLLSLAQG